MIMPAFAIALPLAAVIGRVLKNTMMDVMVQDYILLARIKGLSNTRILLQEACAMPPFPHWR
jgi:ABC-type dipeptide/oligopeptide/nickel transport system permease component